MNNNFLQIHRTAVSNNENPNKFQKKLFIFLALIKAIVVLSDQLLESYRKLFFRRNLFQIFFFFSYSVRVSNNSLNDIVLAGTQMITIGETKHL